MIRWRTSAVLAAAAALLVAAAAGAEPGARLNPHRFLRPPTPAQCARAFGAPCYRPAQLQRAYDLRGLYRAGLNGRGRTIVIVDAFGSPTIRHDLTVFDRTFGLPDPSLRILRPAGRVPPYRPDLGDRVGWAEETSLDVEYAHAMAPGAAIVLVETPVDETEGATGFPQIVAAENYVINHGLGDVISQSFAATEQTFSSRRQILGLRSAFVNAARHGVSVLGASGDNGPAGYRLDNRTFYPFPVNSWPSSDPLVTSVGGTRVFLDGRGRRLRPDVAWNDGGAFPQAGGGGPSAVFARPRYQDGVRAIVGARRGTPDVSMSASAYGAAIVYVSFSGVGVAGPGWYPINGTSEAVPLFAGIVAIADQAAGRRLGLLNPALYALAARHAAGLLDVRTGDTTVRIRHRGRLRTVRGYRARRGYDLATGLGTVDAARLVAELR
ncbi:MAG TPA: S53 family peptidase [Solirubrobacteraceae bacterium]|nr:S53 family peptidase [Solirubrobacteraceae bacterium]